MNKLSAEKRAQIVSCLVEGNSIRSTVRMTGAAKNTVTKLLVDLGQACSRYQDETLRNLECSSIQVDEIWSFCYSKQKNIPEDKQGQFGYGDVWTWTSICADSKLVPSWLIGGRDAEWANIFMNDLASRLKHRVQLSSDGHRAYLEAVEGAFGCEVDYAMLIECAVALHFMYYNFSRIHRTLKVTPAMAAGVTSKLWEIKDIVGLLD